MAFEGNGIWMASLLGAGMVHGVVRVFISQKQICQNDVANARLLLLSGSTQVL